MPGRDPTPQPGRTPSARRHARYDEDDDFDVGHPRGADHPTSAGMVGFIFALVSLGLLVVVVVLFLFLQQEDQVQQNASRKRWMLYWFLLLDVLSFCASLAATVLGGRGLTPSNQLYRGWSMFALILGITGIVVTILFGIFMTCAVMIFEVFGGK
jgi:hypothetical protein